MVQDSLSQRVGRYGPLACILGLAFVLRVWNVSELSLRHYDEGIYCSAASSVLLGRMDLPVEVAPPLFPLLIAGMFVLFGVTAPAAIAVSIVAGTATVAVAYGLGSRLAGRSAGLLAAAALAVNPIHLVYSRMALTDALFGLLMGLSLILIARAIERRGWGDWCMAGVVVGLCMNAKYHGALPWVFLAAAVAPRVAGRRETGLRDWGPRALVGVAISAALALPWIVFIQSSVGLATFLQHRTGYTSWPTGEHWKIYAWSLAVGASWPLIAGGLAAVGWCLRRWRADGLMVSAAFVGFLMLLTMYTPYPRLTVPLIVLACVGSGVAIHAIGSASKRRRAAQIAACIIVLLPGIAQWAVALRPNTGYRDAANHVRQIVRQADPPPSVCLAFVRETPALQFMLGGSGLRLGPLEEAGPAGIVVVADRAGVANERLEAFLRKLPAGSVSAARFDSPFPFLWPMPDDEKRLAGTPPDPLLPDPRYVTVYRIGPFSRLGD